MIEQNVSAFFELARERYQIKRRREAGGDGPWTQDPILAKYRFCNVFREDDKTTAWFRDALRNPLREKALAVTRATIVFRWFCRISTGEKLVPFLLNTPEDALLDWEAIYEALKDCEPLVTGSYTIVSPQGLPKLEGIISILKAIEPELPYLIGAITAMPPKARSLERVWKSLRQLDFVGDFVAYEIVSDLRYTSLLDQACDINTWASAGPGTTQGLGQLVANDPDKFSPTGIKDRIEMLSLMRQLLASSRLPEFWPTEWPQWEMREVEHVLCEYFKYRRTAEGGQAPRQIFSTDKSERGVSKRTSAMGFMFGPGGVVLIRRKATDLAPATLFNGVYTSVPSGELPLNALRQAFSERTGMQCDNWEFRGKIVTPTEQIFLCRAFDEADQAINVAADSQDDVIRVTPGVPQEGLDPSLAYLLPYLQDRRPANKGRSLQLEY